MKLLSYKAPWCVHCKAFAKPLAEFTKAHPEIPLEVVDCDELTSDQNKVAITYGIRALPTTLLLDDQGKILARLLGGGEVSDLEDLLRRGKLARRVKAGKKAKKGKIQVPT